MQIWEMTLIRSPCRQKEEKFSEQNILYFVGNSLFCFIVSSKISFFFLVIYCFSYKNIIKQTNKTIKSCDLYCTLSS